MTIKNLRRLESGGLPIVSWAIKKLGLREILGNCISAHGNDKIEPAETLLLILYNLTLGRRPLYELSKWCSNINPLSIGCDSIDCEALNDDRFGRALDKLYDIDRASLMIEVVIKAVKAFNLNLDQIHNDSTTAKTYGEVPGKTKDELEFKHGHSKDHRPDLKQLVFCMSITSDGAVPVHFKAYSGNITDDTTHKETWNTLRKIKGSSDFMYVADCKVCTNDQLNHIAGNGGRVVTIIPSTWKEVKAFKNELRQTKKAKTEILRKPLPSQTYSFIPEEKRKFEYYSAFSGEYKTDNGYAIHWIFSSEKNKRDQEQREDFLKKTESMFSELNSKLNVRKYKNREVITKAVNDILTANETKMFFTIDISTNEKLKVVNEISDSDQINKVKTEQLAPNLEPYFYLTWSRNLEELKREKNIDGIFPLLSTENTLKAIDVLNFYKYQPSLEKRFSQLKSFQKLMPILFKKVERVEAMMFLYFIGMMIQALIEREVRGNMKAKSIEYLNIYPEEMAAFRPTTPIVLETFEGIFKTIVTHQKESAETTEEIFDALTETQIQVLDMLGMKPENYWRP